MKIIFKFEIHALSFICNSIEAEKINIQYIFLLNKTKNSKENIKTF